MFNITSLKQMKLTELQEVAKVAKTIKYFNVKKEDLIALILGEQSKIIEKPVKNSVELTGQVVEAAAVITAKKVQRPRKPSGDMVVDELIIENSTEHENNLFSSVNPFVKSQQNPAPQNQQRDKKVVRM